jgi:hypothetical protein
VTAEQGCCGAAIDKPTCGLLAQNAIRPDEIKCMLFALHRAGHLDRRQPVHLQVKYLREAKP